MKKLNILVVSDSILFRSLLLEAINGTELGTVKHNVPNFSLALEWLDLSEIHVLLLDAMLLEVIGIEMLDIVRKEKPQISILLTCSGELKNQEIIVEALQRGAIDYIPKVCEVSDKRNIENITVRLKSLFAEIQLKIASAGLRTYSGNTAKLHGQGYRDTVGDKNVFSVKKSAYKKADLILIASSTGGPQALETVLENIPGNLKVPVLVVQHMPPEFTRILALTLDKKSALHVIQANDNDRVMDNCVMIAPGGLHMKVAGLGQPYKSLRMENTPFVNGVRPAADVLFTSVAEEFAGKDVLVVILTGMGSDGAKGLQELKKKCNCYCITQSESTCVVYGMPRCVFEIGLSDEVVDLDKICDRLVNVALGK
jgi:two-component system, chemotaxis family, protein-glutamate methylesterase/glutaminase